MVSLAELLVGKGINGHFDLGFGLVACTIKLQSWNVHVSNGCRVSLNTPGGLTASHNCFVSSI